MQVLRLHYQNKKSPTCVKVLQSFTDYVDKHGEDAVFWADIEGILRAHMTLPCDQCNAEHLYEDYVLISKKRVTI